MTALLLLIVDLSSGTLLGILQALLNEMLRLIDISNQKSYVNELQYIINFQVCHISRHGGQESDFGIPLMVMKVLAL
ncbi:hypothetical protein OIDMADRAFT_21611, partial [Oidiodendron maius Zn]